MGIVIKCHSCGVNLDEADKFCFKCGSPQNEKRLCSKCNAILQQNAKFCTRCGQKYVITELEEIEDEITDTEEVTQSIEEILDELYSISIPSKDQLPNFIEKFDVIRKSEEKLDNDKRLQVLLNGASSIVTNYASRPYLIKALQAYNEAYTISNQQGDEDLANQIRFVLVNLNVKFADLIPNPAKRTRYYAEAMRLVKELEREVQEGDILGEDTIRVYMMYAEVLQRHSMLKEAINAVNVAENLTPDYPQIRNEVALLKSFLLVDSARYVEAEQILNSIQEEKLSRPIQKEYLDSQILLMSNVSDGVISKLEAIANHPDLNTQERIKIKLQLTKELLEIDPDRSKTVFALIFLEELDAQQKDMMKSLSENIQNHIKRSQVSPAIKIGNAEKELRDLEISIRTAQRSENWDNVAFHTSHAIEVLEDYQEDLDPNCEKIAEMNFKLGTSLFQLREYELAQAHFEISISHYKNGVGDPSQLPTCYKHLTDTLIQLRDFEEAYRIIIRGKQSAEKISHPGLIREFSEMLQKYNPQRLKKLHTFNMNLIEILNQMNDVNNFYAFYKALSFSTQTAPSAVKLFSAVTLSLLRSDIRRSIALHQQIPNVRMVCLTALNRPRLSVLVKSPIRVFNRIPKFSMFRTLFISATRGVVPQDILAVLLTDAMIDFVINVNLRGRQVFRGDEIINQVITNFRTAPDDLLAIMILGCYVKSVEVLMNK